MPPTSAPGLPRPAFSYVIDCAMFDGDSTTCGEGTICPNPWDGDTMSHERQGRKLRFPGRHLGGVPSNRHFPSSDTARAEGTGGATGHPDARIRRPAAGG